MSDRRRTRAGLAVVTAVALVSGCTSPPATPAPPSASASTAADPAAAAALAQAAQTLGDTSFRVAISSASGLTMDGQVDPRAGNATGTLNVAGSSAAVTALLIGHDLYVKVPGITPDGRWTHVDVSRLPEGTNFGLRPGQVDPANTRQLIASATDVRKTADRRYEGTVDLTKAAGVTGVDQVNVQGWGDAANRVPFAAELDPQGRLSTLTLQLPASAGQLVMRYSDYGSPVTVQRPSPVEVTEAPDALYQRR